MCFHAHYIFLTCGHSVSSLHPIHPSPPCPNQAVARDDSKASQRRFSFDSSVIATSASPHPEPFPAQTPWRLERPFSSPDSPSPNANGAGDGNEAEAVQGDTYGGGVWTSIDNESETEHAIRHRGGRGPGTSYSGSCGQILRHPYRSYKIEGLCLRCRRRRDIRIAIFEVNAIKETVNRESGLGQKPAPQRGAQELSSYAEVVDGEDESKLKPLPLPLQTPVHGSRIHFQADEGPGHQEEQQQQRPWRLTMPPAEIPTTGFGLAGMRNGEWI